MGVDAPDIFGLGVEDVARLADGAPPTAAADATLRYNDAGRSR
jgi:hypothetical protein